MNDILQDYEDELDKLQGSEYGSPYTFTESVKKRICREISAFNPCYQGTDKSRRVCAYISCSDDDRCSWESNYIIFKKMPSEYYLNDTNSTKILNLIDELYSWESYREVADNYKLALANFNQKQAKLYKEYLLKEIDYDDLLDRYIEHLKTRASDRDQMPLLELYHIEHGCTLKLVSNVS